MTIHHAAIVTSDVDRSLRFWRDGLGMAQLMDHTFTGDWPTLFGAQTETLRSVFLGDPDSAEAGIVELVMLEGAQQQRPNDLGAPTFGFFLLSLNRDVDATLARLRELGFDDGVRRITMPAPHGSTVQMAVITAPDGVLVELIGAPQ